MFQGYANFHITEPTEPPKRPHLEWDLGYTNTHQLCDLLVQPFKNPLTSSPTVELVSKLLQTPLGTKLPCCIDIPPEILEALPFLLPDHPLATRFPSLVFLLSRILQQDREIFTSPRACEDDLHSLWDDIIRYPLYFLSLYSEKMYFEFMRNVVDGYKTSTVRERAPPDFLCYLRGALVLRGEEKRRQSDLEEARAELIQKFGDWSVTFYGELPFVLAYATGGTKIKYRLPSLTANQLTNGWLCSFYLLTPRKECLAIFPDPLNMVHISSRLQVFQVIVNTFRLLYSFLDRLPTDTGRPRLFSTMERPGGIQVPGIIWPPIYFMLTPRRSQYTPHMCENESLLSGLTPTLQNLQDYIG